MTVMFVSRPFLDTSEYSAWELFWYVGGFLVWTPAYVAIIWRAVRRHELEIPVLAAIANVTWEFVWGFTVTVPMGWGLQTVYQGAFLIDFFILLAVYKYGWKQTDLVIIRRWWPVIVTSLVVAFGAFYITIERQGYDLPLGSNSAYLDNVMMSALYLWFGLTRDPATLSTVAAWSKGLGTGMVTVFVFLAYPDSHLVQLLGIIVAVLDVTYLVVLRARHHGWVPARAA
jgi:hypothetical protein